MISVDVESAFLTFLGFLNPRPLYKTQWRFCRFVVLSEQLFKLLWMIKQCVHELQNEITGVCSGRNLKTWSQSPEQAVFPGDSRASLSGEWIIHFQPWADIRPSFSLTTTACYCSLVLNPLGSGTFRNMSEGLHPIGVENRHVFERYPPKENAPKADLGVREHNMFAMGCIPRSDVTCFLLQEANRLKNRKITVSKL